MQLILLSLLVASAEAWVLPPRHQVTTTLQAKKKSEAWSELSGSSKSGSDRSPSKKGSSLGVSRIKADPVKEAEVNKLGSQV